MMEDWKPRVRKYCKELVGEFDLISGKRNKLLHEIAGYVNQSESPRLIVICTHNSRRSHFGQIWLQVAADYFDQSLRVYSGGTEATAFHENAVNAIKRAGFSVSKEGNDNNPRYWISYKPDSERINCFSKRFDEPVNPQAGFGAIMVCSDAAEACPVVHGAERRFVLPYSDPKAYDGTGLMEKKYDERCREIGREMFFIMHKVRQGFG